jgi:RecB family endonuclease NucS
MATAMHVNDMEVGISGPLKESDQTSALNMENIYSSEAKIDDTSSMTTVHVNNIEVGISMPLKESDQTSAFNMVEIYSSEANREYVIGENKRMQAKNEKERSDDTTPIIHPPPPWVSGW